uniref:Chitinase n=1 Tax=Thermogemmatispora argillosa TaxID=2045280 RepID=A0A455T8H2_9CHLR|nr:chitinase [Thermogemmatispora argillosa]
MKPFNLFHRRIMGLPLNWRAMLLMSAALLVSCAIAVVTTIQSQQRPAQAATALSSAWYNAAPYVMPLANNPPSLTAVMSATGARVFTLAFIVADNGCTPAWEADSGLIDVSADTQVGPIINAVRAAGGDVVVSFGGYNGTKLGQVCGTAQATAAAEQAVINKYGLRAIDLDLEEPEYENASAINNELAAAQILQANNPGLLITITLPGTTSGTGYFGQQLLNTAHSLGYTPSSYSIMPFDGGFNGASSQISALQSFHTILMNTFGWDSATAYAHEGISSMNGRTDSGEYFYQSDFQTVLSFVESNHLARFTFWSVNRDRQCTPPDNNGNLSATCSSVPQNDWDFTRIITQFAQAAGGTPPATPTATPIPTTTATATLPTSTPTPTPTPTSSAGSSCTGVAPWSPTTAYTGGSKVTYNGYLWQAKWWTYNDVPGGPAGVWVQLGPC